MLIHHNPLFSIYFGDSRHKIEPTQCKQLTSDTALNYDPFLLFKKSMGLSALFFLHQVHGDNGMIITESQEPFPLFTKDGDYLITNQRGVGLGVATADCLPIIIIDRVKNAVGIAHAGWKGSLSHIVQKIVAHLEVAFETKKKDLEVFFGPSARGCCYEVDESFIEQMRKDPLSEKAIVKKTESYCFDLVLYNVSQLISFGLSESQLVFDYNTCTLCHDTFCSYRRQNGISARQITVVSLK